VIVTQSDLILTGKSGPLTSTGLTVNGSSATWTFASLPTDKYVIDLLDSVTDTSFVALDGEPDDDGELADLNDYNGTPDDPGDDPHNIDFSVVGNGVEGGPFRFLFATDSGSDVLPAIIGKGDYVDDELVDMQDYLLWKGTFGSTEELEADGNGDGVVNAADYVIWRNNVGGIYGESAWAMAGSGALAEIPLSLVQFGAAPTVLNVIISGSNSTHDPFEFD
jgi:hypothetical protein